MSRPDPTPTVPMHLGAADWEDVLDGLGGAAERTCADIDCVTCTGDTACERHDGDWARVDRWRELATQLRAQLTSPHQATQEPR